MAPLPLVFTARRARGWEGAAGQGRGRDRAGSRGRSRAERGLCCPAAGQGELCCCSGVSYRGGALVGWREGAEARVPMHQAGAGDALHSLSCWLCRRGSPPLRDFAESSALGAQRPARGSETTSGWALAPLPSTNRRHLGRAEPVP